MFVRAPKRHAVARIHAERVFLRLHRKEYRRLVRSIGHAEAIRQLVSDHRRKYAALVKAVDT